MQAKPAKVNGEPNRINHFSAPAREIAAPLRQSDATINRVERFTIGRLQEQFPTLNPPILEGLARVGETINLISVSKIGKSWLVYILLLCIVTGRFWLGRFRTTRGRVLLIDNELHKPTLASRFKTVADAMGIRSDEYADEIDVWPLRGQLRTLAGLAAEFDGLEGQYQLVVVDAKYRALEPGISESDNQADTAFYNLVDSLAEKLGAAVLLVHHSSKGNQSEKRVTDVGSGAGAQSRAVDCHLILREHEDADAVVLEAAVRSFAPVEPIVLRWNFPLWQADVTADPRQLKGKKSASEENQDRSDTATEAAILKHCAGAWRSRSEIRTLTGFGPQRANRGIRLLLETSRLEQSMEDRPRNPGTEVFRSVLDAE